MLLSRQVGCIVQRSMFKGYGIYKGTVKAGGKVKHVAAELLK
jgi:TfoX/Sxy family transcriptional regulator of competence genes